MWLMSLTKVLLRLCALRMRLYSGCMLLSMPVMFMLRLVVLTTLWLPVELLTLTALEMLMLSTLVSSRRLAFPLVFVGTILRQCFEEQATLVRWFSRGSMSPLVNLRSYFRLLPTKSTPETMGKVLKLGLLRLMTCPRSERQMCLSPGRLCMQTR